MSRVKTDSVKLLWKWVIIPVAMFEEFIFHGGKKEKKTKLVLFKVVLAWEQSLLSRAMPKYLLLVKVNIPARSLPPSLSLTLLSFAMFGRKHWVKHPHVVCEVSCQEKDTTTPFPKSWPRHYICAVQEHVKPLKHSCFGYSLMEVKWACPQSRPPSRRTYRLLPEPCNYADSSDSNITLQDHTKINSPEMHMWHHGLEHCLTVD